jgi:hypothetical protein
MHNDKIQYSSKDVGKKTSICVSCVQVALSKHTVESCLGQHACVLCCVLVTRTSV